MEKRKHYTVTYRDRSYEFDLRYTYGAGGGYRAYIEDMPGYGSRSDASSATSRGASGGERWIDWNAEIDTEAEMDRAVELWCQATAMYIADGGSSIHRYIEMIRNGISGRKTYTVAYGGKAYDFVFQYQKAGGGYRAYILSMPDYGNRDAGLSVTHRLKDGSRYYVCWSQEIGTEEALDAVVALWARATVMYIELGGTSIDKYAERLLEA